MTMSLSIPYLNLKWTKLLCNVHQDELRKVLFFHIYPNKRPLGLHLHQQKLQRNPHHWVKAPRRCSWEWQICFSWKKVVHPTKMPRLRLLQSNSTDICICMKSYEVSLIVLRLLYLFTIIFSLKGSDFYSKQLIDIFNNLKGNLDSKNIYSNKRV